MVPCGSMSCGALWVHPVWCLVGPSGVVPCGSMPSGALWVSAGFEFTAQVGGLVSGSKVCEVLS